MTRFLVDGRAELSPRCAYTLLKCIWLQRLPLRASFTVVYPKTDGHQDEANSGHGIKERVVTLGIVYYCLTRKNV